MEEVSAIGSAMLTPGPGANWEAVRAWRQSKRKALIAARLAIPKEMRRDAEARIVERLDGIVAARVPRVIGFYWPFKGEVDLRPLCRRLHESGVELALPVVVEPRRPVEFRIWSPGAPMEHGVWQIPVPKERHVVAPDLLFVALVGFDDRHYRLGYGGGYYDRTLAASETRPFAVGVGFARLALETICPQPHDIPMDLIVTEDAR